MSLDIKYLPEGTDGAANTPADPVADRQDRNKYLQELYAKLQALFPGIDPKKEPAFPIQNARPGGPQPGQMQQKGSMGSQGSPGMGQVQRTPQMANMPAPPAAS